jgi:hypothetical protein
MQPYSSTPLTLLFWTCVALGLVNIAHACGLV